MPIAPRTAIAVVTCALAWATAAHADTCEEKTAEQTTAPSADEVATAKQLFTKARTMLAAGKANAACKMFESSQLLDPQIGTRLNVAACREQIGDLVGAMLSYQDAASETAKTGDPRNDFVRGKLSVLAGQLVKVTVHVAEPTTTGISMRVAGCPIAQVEAASSKFARPGSIVVDVSAPGRKSFHKDEPGAAGTELVIDVPALGGETDPKAEERAKQAEAQLAVEHRRAEEATARLYGRHPARKWAIIGGSVGAAAVITGTVFGVLAHGAQNDFNSAQCGNRDHVLDPAAFAACTDDRNRGQRDATYANALWIGGGVALAAATVVLVLDPGHRERPDPPRTTVLVTPRSVGLAVTW